MQPCSDPVKPIAHCQWQLTSLRPKWKNEVWPYVRAANIATTLRAISHFVKWRKVCDGKSDYGVAQAHLKPQCGILPSQTPFGES